MGRRAGGVHLDTLQVDREASARVAHSIPRIRAEVHQDLLQLGRVGQHQRRLGVQESSSVIVDGNNARKKGRVSRSTAARETGVRTTGVRVG